MTMRKFMTIDPIRGDAFPRESFPKGMPLAWIGIGVGVI